MATSSSGRPFLLVLLLASAAACATPAAGGRAAAALALAAPAGETVTLEALGSGRDLVVLVFWSAECPCVRRYQERVDALLDAYPADRVRVVGVSSNAGERYDAVLATARERGVRLPIYRDEGGRLAAAVGARSTPTVVVLDGAGEVRYRGWVDNERLPGEPGREAWLDAALAALLEGRRDYRDRTPLWGCVITRSLFDPKPAGCCSATP
jgi:hypothetical protein